MTYSLPLVYRVPLIRYRHRSCLPSFFEVESLRVGKDWLIGVYCGIFAKED
jgi:hypothetical protein